jgi:tRNA 5-methylaminomethyl-2-thiouridine biosynthesis bifunctional protein
MKLHASDVIKTEVMVVGAGIAGAAIAGELHRQGKQVVIFDRQLGPACETSAHQMALAHPQLGRKITKLQRFTQYANAQAFVKWGAFQMHQYAFEPRKDLTPQEAICLKELIVEMGFDAAQIEVLDSQEAYEKTNIRTNGLWFKKAAVYNLAQICEKEIEPLGQIWDCKIQKIQKVQNEWQIINDKNQVIGQAPVLILAGNLGVAPLLKSIGIELLLRPVRGQMSTFTINHYSPLAPILPKVCLRGDGYCMPARRVNEVTWSWSVGSSYDEDESSMQVLQSSHRENAIKGLNLIGCDHSLIGELELDKSFVGIRSASKDRLPLIGPVPDHEGLFIACGYGSRGVIWATLGTKLVSAYVDAFLAGAVRLRAGFFTGAASGLSAELASSVTPARFLAGAFGARASNSKPIFPDS